MRHAWGRPRGEFLRGQYPGSSHGLLETWRRWHVHRTRPSASKRFRNPSEQLRAQPTIWSAIGARYLSQTSQAAQAPQSSPTEDTERKPSAGRNSPSRDVPSSESSYSTTNKSFAERKSLDLTRLVSGAPSAPAQGKTGLAKQVGETQTLELPTTEEYPSLPRDASQNPKAFLESLLAGIAKLDKRIDPLGKEGGETREKYHLKCTFVDEEKIPVEVVAKGESRIRLERAVYLELLAKLHEQKLLSSAFKERRLRERAGKKSAGDPLSDVYDYCAAYGTVPKVSIETPSLSTPRFRRIFQVTIEMPEQGIFVRARLENFVEAERVAAFRFQEKAEEYHEERDTVTPAIKDPFDIRLANTKDFFVLYKFLKSPAEFSVSSVMDSPNDLATAQGNLNGEPFMTPATTKGRERAEDFARLTCAVELIRQEPDLLAEFRQALKKGNGRILLPMTPIDLFLGPDSLFTMRNNLVVAEKAALEYNNPDAETEDYGSAYIWNSLQRPGPVEVQQRAKYLAAKHRRFWNSPAMRSRRNARLKLPLNQHRSELLELVEKNVFCTVAGATGSGKTTQVPQILLEDAINRGSGSECDIICTQPRRIAALSVAERVATERGELLGKTVGYHIRLESKLAPLGGSINYCTTGILLRKLQHAPDEILENITHLVIDEVHERSLLSDFLLALLKKITIDRLEKGQRVPKIILMSATLDEDLFSSYFSAEHPTLGNIRCPTISIPGRQFPVSEHYLEGIISTMNKAHGREFRQFLKDVSTHYIFSEAIPVDKAGLKGENQGHEVEKSESRNVIEWKGAGSSSKGLFPLKPTQQQEEALIPCDLVAATVAHIAKSTNKGAILVFLPGMAEIHIVRKRLSESKIFGVDFEDQGKFQTFILHSATPESQKSVFDPVPRGCRKIILATNIAETSVTLPDVQYVVDTGKFREKQYEQDTRITRLKCKWISKSSAKQRAGRAGRVREGNYYALFSRSRFDTFRALGLPEILRSDLQDVCLSAKAHQLSAPIREFLASTIEPPHPESVDAAVGELQALGCLTYDEDLTCLGRLLSSLPIHPSLGKMIVLGIIYRCLDPMILLAAASEAPDIFVVPETRKREAWIARRMFCGDSNSDHLATLNAIRDLRMIQSQGGAKALNSVSPDYFLRISSFDMIIRMARQIEQILVASNVIEETLPGERNKNQFGHSSLNENSLNDNLIKTLLVSGLHPKIASRPSKDRIVYRTAMERNVLAHPSSVHSRLTKFQQDEETTNPKADDASLVVFEELQNSVMHDGSDGRAVFMREATAVTPLMACLFGSKRRRRGLLIEVDDWLRFVITGTDGKAALVLLSYLEQLANMEKDAFEELYSRSLRPRLRPLIGRAKEEEGTPPIRKLMVDGLVRLLDMQHRAVARDSWTDIRNYRIRTDGQPRSLVPDAQSGAGIWERRPGVSQTVDNLLLLDDISRNQSSDDEVFLEEEE